MIKTIIIDDDTEMLEGLSHFISWEDYGFTVCGFSKNGSEGLELAEEVMPDVIITDISMPSMNGLELIQEAKKILPRVKSIILSCHEDFHYAKEAIRLGADEYLLKHTLTENELIEVLLRVKERITGERHLTDELSGARQNLNKNKNVINENFFADLLDGSITDETARETAVKLNLPLPPGRFRCASVYFDDLDKTIKTLPIREKGLLKFSILNIIADTLPKQEKANFFAFHNMFVLLFWDSTMMSHDLKLLTQMQKLQKNIERFLTIRASICISGIYHQLSDLNQALAETERLRASYFYHQPGALIFPTADPVRSDEQLYLKYGSEFCNAISMQNPYAIREYLNRLYSDLIMEQHSPSSVRTLFERLLVDLEVLLNKYRISPAPVTIDGDTFASCTVQMDDAVTDGVRLLQERSHTSSRTEIKQVLSYIDLHLNTPISCESMAEMVNLNFSYFSRLFKQEMGVSFSDYLLHKRINVATDLLMYSTYTIEEIIAIIGITSTSYFYRAYKKITGKTPGDVRVDRSEHH